MNKEKRSFLEQTFGSRVTFDEIERLLYSHDIGAVPSLINHLKKPPRYIQEQIPELTPRIMDNLMPHMIGDVVPLVTGPLVDYLQGKKPAQHQ
ncbi:MAG TPA: hypothetical protein PLU81_00240 [Deltaproteobacteria bacterium]|nr:hypothetical protein [Deltaproteobacteria bacterium]HPJ93854.1 hypothetical protein [Deltaproteobacteria bacterium]HPR50186.1 hypothetical protein [Deltaproteobacteria bacterium]